METVKVLANFWGWFLVITCLIYLLKKKRLEEIFQLLENKVFLLVSGYLAFLIGLVSLILYNSWECNWRVIITIFGWISLIKGVMAIGFPEITQKLVEKFKNKPLLIQTWLVIGILLGVWLLWTS
ncbi:MAG: hypothetical protein ACK413_02265 [Patescibacteria group bacterium]